ncbi:MAG: Hsp70 family protein, partial [Saprospiraceae bacterium]|nr:Hsp70 family protein [Saprospiraceae bacterium]
IEVTFDMDANGILSVSAKEKVSGKEQSIRIEASTGLSDEEIQKMRDEAKANADSDKASREKVDKINEADQIIFQTEKQLEEFGDKISDDLKQPIVAAVEELKAAKAAEDSAAIDAAKEKVTQTFQAASQQIYQAQQEAQANAGATEASDAAEDSSDEKDDVTDVEFEEVDDKK